MYRYRRNRIIYQELIELAGLRQLLSLRKMGDNLVIDFAYKVVTFNSVLLVTSGYFIIKAGCITLLLEVEILNYSFIKK
jgi:hypothetical protein